MRSLNGFNLGYFEYFQRNVEDTLKRVIASRKLQYLGIEIGNKTKQRSPEENEDEREIRINQSL